jgi:hypothetical protein
VKFGNFEKFAAVYVGFLKGGENAAVKVGNAFFKVLPP